MSCSRAVRAVLAALFGVLLGSGGAQAEVAVGASFGYTHLSYPDLSDFTNNVVAIPSAQEWGQPGIRVGYVAPSSRWDLNVDVGLVYRSGTLGNDETAVEVLPQVQVNAHGRGGFHPFVNGGVGIVYERTTISSSRSTSGTRPVFGVGIGMRKSVSDRHGFVRAELRYDHVTERENVLGPGSTFVFPATNMFSVKLGFDLLMGVRMDQAAPPEGR